MLQYFAYTVHLSPPGAAEADPCPFVICACAGIFRRVMSCHVMSCHVMSWGGGVRSCLPAFQSLGGAGEKDDRDVIAAIEASKREVEEASKQRGVGRGGNIEEEEEDPELLKAIAESRCDRGTDLITHAALAVFGPPKHR